MSRATADAAVGMMDAAYFTGRKELLDFFNDLLELNLTKIEQTATGAIACQLTELIFPGSIPLSKIDWSARSDYEYVQNYKLLQNAFNKHNVQRHVDVDKLIRAKYQDNLEFCQWLKAFYDHSGTFRDNYDPQAARARGKGGKQFNATMSRNSSSNKKGGVGGGARVAPRTTTTTTTARPAVVVKTVAKEPASPERVSRPLRERTAATAGGSNKDSLSSNNQSSAVADAILIKKNAELTNKNEELEQAVIEIEKERDFYFEKLRNVEVMLQIYQEKDETIRDANHLIDNIFKILYATAEDNLTVTDNGEVLGEPLDNTNQNNSGEEELDHHHHDDHNIHNNTSTNTDGVDESLFSDCLT